MSLSQTNTTLSVTIPAIPILAAYIPQLAQPTQIDLPLAQIKTSLRFIVIVLTYLLFRPHLEKLFRTITGRQSHEGQQDVQERVDMVKRQQAGGAGGKKVYAVATPGPGGKKGAAGSASANTSAASPTTPAGGKSKRRKA